MPWKGPMQMGGSEAEASLAYGEHSSKFLTSHRCGFESGLRHLAAMRAGRRLVLVSCHSCTLKIMIICVSLRFVSIEKKNWGAGGLKGTKSS